MAKPKIETFSERTFDPKQVGFAFCTSYRNWYPGEKQEHNAVDKVRGDLAIQTFTEVVTKGYQLLVFDSESSDSFKDKLRSQGIATRKRNSPIMSAGRRQAFEEVAALNGVEVICHIEPEKVSIIRDCLPQGVLPILEGRADIVVPKRDFQSYATYPDYQVDYEQWSNCLWNKILRKHTILPENSEDLDAWFGPRFIRNDPNILSLFLRKYEYTQGESSLDKLIDLELWPNAIFLPLVSALKEGFRVVSLTVPYRHPLEQTIIEKDSPEFVRKRDIQRKIIITSTIHLIRALENSPKSRLRLVS